MTIPYIDISWPLGPETPTWPGSPGFQASPLTALERGDDANGSLLTLDAHTGTHVDAPLHFLADGAELETLGLDPFVGDAYVAEVQAPRISAEELASLGLPADVRRLLLRTANSTEAALRRAPFREEFAALTEDGARWVVERGIALIGIDYLSIQRFEDSFDTHRVLLDAGVAILEGLRLAEAPAGRYTLVCLPLRVLGVEAAPARAILLPKAEA